MMTVNVRRFGIGMIITLSSLIIIWTECYLHATEAMRNSNERPGIFDVSMMLIFQQLKFIPLYMYIFFTLGLLWIIFSIVLPEKKTSYDGTQLYVSNRNTGSYKWSWILPAYFSLLAAVVHFLESSTGGITKFEDFLFITVCCVLLYCILIPANIESMRSYTFTADGITIHHPLWISSYYPWNDFEEMSFEHERQGSEYNLIIWNSKREYFAKYSPQNVIILYPEEELRYILNFAPEELTENILPLPENVAEVNRKKREKDNRAGLGLFAIYTIIVLAILIGVITYVKTYNV